MKNKIIQLFLFTGFILGSIVFAQAQSVSHFRAHIPFDFAVGEKSFPAGDYSVDFGGLANSRESLLIRSAGGENAALLSVMPEQKKEGLKNSVLVFVLYGNRYHLAEIKTPFLGAKIRKSKSGLKLAENFKPVVINLTK